MGHNANHEKKENTVADTEESIALKWLHQAIELKTGEEIMLPAESRSDLKERKRLLSQELKVLNKVDPVNASQLQIATRFKDHRYWIVLKKVAFSPLIAFKVGTDGQVERVVLEDNYEKLRRIRLMKDDGYSIEEIEEVEGELSKEEKEYLGRERR